ncbi:MAG: MBL fold metallo-hydrolase [Candidatus Eremiobacteraeota bacterium]|nr:MBL fold metallo-hydrolase [Candidatus Eremiobacteraeota bacterium]
MNDLVLTVLYDNYPANPELKTSWGFSCLVQGGDKVILFDTGGEDGILMDNMASLGINPAEIDIIILSHSDWDHVGGLDSFLEKNSRVKVYLLASFPQNIKNKVEKYGGEIVEVTGPVDIIKGFFSTGELGNGKKEQALGIITEKGLVVITGCAHPGVENMVESAIKCSEKNPLLVIGGFHFFTQLFPFFGKTQKAIKKLHELKTRYVAPCHCTGKMGISAFKKSFGKYFIPTGVGSVIKVSEL